MVNYLINKTKLFFNLKKKTTLGDFGIILFRKALKDSDLFIKDEAKLALLGLSNEDLEYVFQEILIFHVYIYLDLIDRKIKNGLISKIIFATYIEFCKNVKGLEEKNISDFIQYTKMRFAMYSYHIEEISKSNIPSLGRVLMSNLKNCNTIDSHISLEGFIYYTQCLTNSVEYIEQFQITN